MPIKLWQVVLIRKIEWLIFRISLSKWTNEKWIWGVRLGLKAVKMVKPALEPKMQSCVSLSHFKCTHSVPLPSPRSLLLYTFAPFCFACSAWSIIRPLLYLMFLSSTLIFFCFSVSLWMIIKGFLKVKGNKVEQEVSPAPKGAEVRWKGGVCTNRNRRRSHF